MSARRIAAPALATALSLGIAARPVEALTIAQITRHGYVLVDEPNAPAPYEGSAGAASALGFAGFISDVTSVIDEAGGPHADYIAVMQSAPERSVVAFYMRIRNQTRGVGDHSPQGGASETYDLNPQFGTVFPIGGALFLNQPGYYTSGGFSDYGTQIICPQEFGHRFLAQVHIPPVPGMHLPDAGSIDASTTDATAPDADVDATATDGDLLDVEPADAGNPDVPPAPMAIPADSLLGRDRAHWSYFMNSGGSPVEGNAWAEITPGVFRTSLVPIRFSQLDRYLMGLIPASAVEPFFVIAEPDVMGQQDNNGALINRASPPETFGFSPRDVTIRGRRVTYTIDDVIQSNGPRVPAYVPPDGGPPSDGGTETSVTDMRVIWVLLTTADAIDSRTGSNFDRAIEACSMGYATAAGGLAQLVPVVLPQPVDGGTDSGLRDTGVDAPVADGFMAPRITAGGGCACRVTGPGVPTGNGTLALAGLAAGLAWSLRRRRTRTRRAA